MNDNESIIKFPCDFPIKIIGLNTPEFIAEIVQIVNSHHPEFSDDGLKTNLSGNSKFISITATVNAKSQDKLDDLYKELSQHPKIKMVL